MPLNLKPASKEWARTIHQRASELGHPSPETLTAIVHETSRFNPGAAGYNGTVGIGRFTAEQAEVLGIDPQDPYQSIDAVIGIDMQNLQALGDRDAATAAFFAGAETAASFLESGEPLPTEIGGKVRRVKEIVPDIVEEVGPQRSVSAMLPPSPGGETFSEILGTSARDVPLPVLYERALTGEVDQAEFISEYLNRKFGTEGVKAPELEYERIYDAEDLRN